MSQWCINIQEGPLSLSLSPLLFLCLSLSVSWISQIHQIHKSPKGLVFKFYGYLFDALISSALPWKIWKLVCYVHWANSSLALLSPNKLYECISQSTTFSKGLPRGYAELLIACRYLAVNGSLSLSIKHS